MSKTSPCKAIKSTELKLRGELLQVRTKFLGMPCSRAVKVSMNFFYFIINSGHELMNVMKEKNPH